MKKSVFLVLLIVIAAMANGQNQYLSFTEGKKSLDKQSTLPERIVNSHKENGVEIEFKFTGAHIADKKVKGENYNYLHIDGIHKMATVGAPALPAKSEIVAFPRGAQPRIVIIDANYNEYKGFNIHPALEPERDTEGAPAAKFEKDEAVYSKNEFFPKNIAEIVNIGKNRGTGLAFTETRPVQFNPVTGTIRVYTNIKFRVEFNGGVGSFDYIAQENSLHFTNMLKRRVINSDAIPDGISKENIDSKTGAKNYIIITHSEYAAQADELANWKRQLGYSVEVVSQSSWTAPDVKDAISTRYDAWTPKPDYFVILGDHTGSYAVPAEIHTEPDGETFATDLYFACMDGASDWHPDIARGRISVSNSSEASVVVNKIINYEKTPPTSSTYYENGLNCAQFQDKVDDSDTPDGYAARRFCHTSEEIRDYMIDEQNYSVERIYYTDGANTPTNYNNDYYSNGEAIPSELLRSNGYAWDGDQTDITNSINDGKFYVFHRDHGYVGGSGWAHPYYTTSTMGSLSNGDELPVVFSMNCHTGEFQLSECFAEKFVRMENKGAVGVVAAAYYSYSGYNDGMSVGMIDAIWSDPGLYPVMGSAGTGTNYSIGTGNNIYTMGDVVYQGLYAMEQNVSWSSGRQYTYELFHYFGDPAMKIWTANPNDNAITATHNADIDCSGTSFAISGSTAGALATLVYNDELIGETTLDGSGAGAISYSITEPGTEVILTISAHNHKPYTSSLTLSGSCDFPPGLTISAATSITETTATLNGEIINDNGSTVTESGFVYSTTPNPEIGGTGVTQIATDPTITSGTFSENITGLSSTTTYYVKAYAINANGTGYSDETSFATACGIISSLPYTQDFSGAALPDCWENFDNDGSGQVWAFDNPGGRTINTTTGGNGFAIVDSDNYGSGGSQNADLISPQFDLSGMTTVNLSFEHYYNDYSSESASVSYSTDGGSTWNELAAWSGSDTDNGESFSQDLTTEVAGQSAVKFKWNYTGSYGWYWAIDDIEITGTSGTAYTLTFNVTDNETSNAIENAIISINSQTLTTDGSGQATIDLYDGNHTYTVAKAGYQDFSGSVTISGSAVTETVALQPNPAISFECEASPVICNGDINGEIEFTSVSGGSGSGYQYSIDGGTTWQTDATFTDLAANDYSVQVKDDEGGISDAMTETVSEPEVLEFDISPINVSEMGGTDGSIEITGTTGGHGSYTYSIDAGTTWQAETLFADLSAGEYSVAVQDGGGCISDFQTITLTEPQEFTVTFYVTGDDNPVEGATIDINSEMLTTNTDGQANINLVEGDYNYVVSYNDHEDIAGMVSVAGSNLNEYVNFTGIENITGTGRIYPNPTNGQITIEWPGKCQVYVMNALGKTIANIDINNEGTIDLSNATEGIYFVRIKTAQLTTTKRLIINK